ncbi:MAG: hypothetical protein ACN4GM_05025, partial [Gammaproteobacteria bacterium]
AQAQYWRSMGLRLRSQDIKKCPDDLLLDITDQNLFLSIQSNLNVIVARKALAHKLARASYYVMRDNMPFKSNQLFP